MPLLTKRWSDPVKKSDGFRLLICQVRPRAVAKDKENWDQWYPELGPSKELQAAFHGKHGTPIPWEEFRGRYLEEMKSQGELIDGLAELVAEGKTITLLCSSACVKANQCHRSLLKELVDEQAAKKVASVVVAQPAIV
jgi:uncharacterized protein YeaO (DUF488 family)